MESLIVFFIILGIGFLAGGKVGYDWGVTDGQELAKRNYKNKTRR